MQVRILTITDRSDEAAKALAARLEKEGIRTELDLRNEKIGFKVREAQMMKIPYMLVLGDKEVENGRGQRAHPQGRDHWQHVHRRSGGQAEARNRNQGGGLTRRLLFKLNGERRAFRQERGALFGLSSHFVNKGWNEA